MFPSAKALRKSVLLTVEFWQNFQKFKTKYLGATNKRRWSWMFQKEDVFLYQLSDDVFSDSNSRMSSFQDGGTDVAQPWVRQKSSVVPCLNSSAIRPFKRPGRTNLLNSRSKGVPTGSFWNLDRTQPVALPFEQGCNQQSLKSSQQKQNMCESSISTKMENFQWKSPVIAFSPQTPCTM